MKLRFFSISIKRILDWIVVFSTQTSTRLEEAASVSDAADSDTFCLLIIQRNPSYYVFLIVNLTKYTRSVGYMIQK